MANTHRHTASPTMSIQVNLNCIPCLVTAINQLQHSIDALMPPFPTDDEIQREKWYHQKPEEFGGLDF